MYCTVVSSVRTTPNYHNNAKSTYTRTKMESPKTKAMRMMEDEGSVAIESLFPTRRTTETAAEPAPGRDPTDRQTGRQADRQTGRQTDIT